MERIPSVQDVTRRHDDGRVYAHCVCPSCGVDAAHVYTGTGEFFRCSNCNELFAIWTETREGVTRLFIGGRWEE